MTRHSLRSDRRRAKEIRPGGTLSREPFQNPSEVAALHTALIESQQAGQTGAPLLIAVLCRLGDLHIEASPHLAALHYAAATNAARHYRLGDVEKILRTVPKAGPESALCIRESQRFHERRA